MPAQGLFRITQDIGDETFFIDTSSAISCYDPSESISATFLAKGLCHLAYSQDSSGAVRDARYVFGIRSQEEAGPVQRLNNTVSTCTALTGFDVVFANCGSPQIHCLPLGDFVSDYQDFFPALYFASMPGEVTGLCKIDEAEAMAASDHLGGLALFSTVDATRLAYQNRASPESITALSVNSYMLVSGSKGGDVKVWDTSGMNLTPLAALSAHGHITGLGIARPECMVSQNEAWGSRSHHHAVAATADGDVVTWLLDIDAHSEVGTVVEVGMIKVADKAVRQVEMIQGLTAPGVAVRCECSDEGMSRICCIDVAAVAAPRVLADWPVRNACHMHVGTPAAGRALQVWALDEAGGGVHLTGHSLEELGMHSTSQGTGNACTAPPRDAPCELPGMQHPAAQQRADRPQQADERDARLDIEAGLLLPRDSTDGTLSLRQATQQAQAAEAAVQPDEAAVGSTGDEDEARMRLAALLGLADGLDSPPRPAEHVQPRSAAASPLAAEDARPGSQHDDKGASVHATVASHDAEPAADGGEAMSWDALRCVREQLEAMCGSGDEDGDTGEVTQHRGGDVGLDSPVRASCEQLPSHWQGLGPQHHPGAEAMPAELQGMSRPWDAQQTNDASLPPAMTETPAPRESGAATYESDACANEGPGSDGSASLCHSALFVAASSPADQGGAAVLGRLPPDAACGSPAAKAALHLDDWLADAEEAAAGVQRAAASGSASSSGGDNSSEPFALSKLCAAAADQHTHEEVLRPQCSSSTGGVSWTIVQPRTAAAPAPGSRVCGRSPGTVAPARRRQGAAPRSPGISASAGVNREGGVRSTAKPSSQALLRRLLRKKPTVRQILGKDPALPPAGRRLPSPRASPGVAGAPQRARSPSRAAAPQPRRASRIPPARAAPRGKAQEVVLLPVRPPGGQWREQEADGGNPLRQPLRERGNDMAHATPSPSKMKGSRMRASSKWLGGLAQGVVAPESDISGLPAKALQPWRAERSCGEAVTPVSLPSGDAGGGRDPGMATAAYPCSSTGEQGGSPHPLSLPRPGGMTQLLATRLALAAAAEPPTGSPPGWAESPEGIAARRAAATRAVNVPRGVTLYPRKSPGAARSDNKQRGAQKGAEHESENKGGGTAGARTSKARKPAAARAMTGPVVPAPLMSDLWREDERVMEVIDSGHPEPGCPESIAHITADLLGLHWPA